MQYSMTTTADSTTTTTTTLESLFDSIAPPETVIDETVRDYVCSVLQNEEEDGGDDNNLIATLQAVLEASMNEDEYGDAALRLA